ncbi:hypothetical protein FA95DRAFT_1505403, partial [Auriscalpium vulgare]
MTTLNVPLPQSTDDLTQRAQDNALALIAASRSTSDLVSKDEIPQLIRQAIREENSRPFRPRTFRSRPNRAQASAHLASGNGEEAEEVDFPIVNEDDEENLNAPDEVDPAVTAQVFATLVKRQRAPPKGGYPFPKADGTKSLIKPPPSPCKLCGSKHHWDKECPHWPTYAKKREVNLLSAGLETDRTPEDELMYNTLYESYLMEAISSAYIVAREHAWSEADHETRGVYSSNRGNEDEQEIPTKREVLTAHARGSLENIARRPSPSVEEIEDEYYVQLRRNGGSSPRDGGLLEEIEVLQAETPGLETIKLKRKRTSIPGMSAVGVSVVSMRGRIMVPTGPIRDLRLDSCADISLLSKATYDQLINPPALRQGLKLKLVQLTAKEASLHGYVMLPIYVRTVDGRELQLEVEAYVVSNMSVPILLGEDFHQAYELTVERSLDAGTRVYFEGRKYEVLAEGVHGSSPKRRALRKDAEGPRNVRVIEEVKIPPHSVKRVQVTASFTDERTWLVEKTMVASSRNPTFVVPNVLLNQSSPFIPVANTSSHPKILRKGEVIGRLVDPAKFLDVPENAGKLEALVGHANLVKRLVE